MRRARLETINPILDVRDVGASLQFYVLKLGFEVAFRWEQDPNNYAGICRNDVTLHMQWQSEEHFRAGRAGNIRLRIKVDDPDALIEEYRRAGAFGDDVDVRDTEWGTREFGFRDPDGNGLIFYRDNR